MNYSITSSKDNRVHVIDWEDGVNATVNGTWTQAASIGRARSITRQTEANVAAIDHVLLRLRDAIQGVEHVSNQATHAIALLEGL